jgi:uncharacterized membrane protein YgcG
MSGVKAGYRQRLFKAVHAEAVKRRMDHDALHDMCAASYGVHSMSELTDSQLLAIYRLWTGKTLKRRAALADPDWKAQPDGLVSGEEINAIAQEFAKRGLGLDGQRNFVRRQLGGREAIRTRKDYIRVMHGLRAMNLRDERRGTNDERDFTGDGGGGGGRRADGGIRTGSGEMGGGGAVCAGSGSGSGAGDVLGGAAVGDRAATEN